MNRRSRRTTVTSVIACSLLAGGMAALAPTATAAPALGTCTVKPAANGLSVTISGSGWDTNVALQLNDGESTVDLNLGPDGTFLVKRFQKPTTDFVVLPATGGFLNCKLVKADKDQLQKDKDEIRKARKKGFDDGVKAGKEAAKETCGSPAKHKKHPNLTAQEQAVEDAYAQGFLAGAQSAFDKFCRPGKH
ncbi:hypothetical protein [Streptomyces sp. NBC_00091]|uniref:hypothetical protein n=1 Tax=Streptomyces sp. NBC_00091 TaxID=2975648 RepID=UPI00224FE9E2|nr:hypothetical protein [Streptomyces sp. NBC_00091]MCX5379899.1 hypothetical protein [Streptomyces sp. NBC_00091]